VAGPLVKPAVTKPVARPMVAIVVVLLVQVPLVVTSTSKVVDPEQTATAPEINEGDEFIVTGVLLEQPVSTVYVIVSIPGVTPLITPVPAGTVAIPVLLLLHVPPVVPSIKVAVEPVHATLVPLMTDGSALTVTIVVMRQLVGNL
jgi:hypothetical protein